MCFYVILLAKIGLLCVFSHFVLSSFEFIMEVPFNGEAAHVLTGDLYAS